MNKSEVEQLLAQMRDVLPRTWMAIYQGSLAAGFDSHEAFTLTQTYILSQGTAPTMPPRGAGPKSDVEE